MFEPETKILFQDPTSEVRRLRSATVVESGRESFSIRFDGERIELAEGQELICYFHGRREFMQQALRVVRGAGRASQLPVALQPVGDPISAEHRKSHRFSAISVDLFAAVGADRGLVVEDVSSTGFAVVSAVEYPIGTALEASLTFEGDIYSGTVLVQSVRAFTPARLRYGLRALEEGDLTEGLQQISLAVAQQQCGSKGSGP